MSNNTEEVEVTYTKGLVNWQEDGNLILGLDRSAFEFQGKNPTPEQKLEAKKQFFLYRASCKDVNMQKLQEKIDRLREAKQEYFDKAENIGKEVTAEEKIKAKIAKAKKMIEEAEKSAEALGVEL